MNRVRTVDVIIPIYNAYEDLVNCINSLNEWTDYTVDRLILINDCSPDERIAPYLDSLRSERIIVIHNEHNVGFSGNINTGIRQSENHDVLLLNSDTVVTRGWLEKIKRCAYSDIAIATVTPLSNNATLCSVPVFCEDNLIPEGYTIDSYAELIERVSLREYPRLPVAHGFCMFVKREVIEKIGYFDVATFGRGYGEENDFCHRAEQVGYRHAMCDDTFIYHSGTSSFESEEKKRYIEEHDKILLERYPEQVKNTAVHCRDNPNHRIFDNINLHTGLSNDKKNILYLIQSDFREGASDNIGGTQLHVKDLAVGLKGDFNVYVAARDMSYLNLTAYIGDKEYFFRFYIGSVVDFAWIRDKYMGALYGKILDLFQIDSVHVHHVVGLSFEVYYQAYERQIPIITTLHDYYYVCPTIKLLDTENRCCIYEYNENQCKTCLKKRCGISETIPFLSVWQDECQKVLEMAKVIVVPSEAAKLIYLKYYPGISGKIRVVYHGSEKTRQPEIAHTGKKFNVAFVGGISDAKGSYVSSRLVKASSMDIVWHLFGIYGHNDLSITSKNNFIKTGTYERNELPELMEQYQIDLVCILPIWPETFCYTLSEVVMCGVPVIATEIGALKERIEDMQCGWLVPYNASEQDIMEIIERIKDYGPEYQEKLSAARKFEIRSLKDMCIEYKGIYEESHVIERSIDQDYQWILNAYLLAGNPGQVQSDGRILERLNEVEKEINAIRSSITYRIMSILGRMKIPFRKQIKQVLFIIYRKIN